MNTKVVATIARMNPPTIGHDRVIKAVQERANQIGATPMVFIVDGIVSGKDKRKNPLSGDDRVEILREIYPSVKFEVITTASDILDVLYITNLKLDTLVAGSDRIDSYGRMVRSDFPEAHLFSLYRDENASNIEGVTATKVRQMVSAGNFQEFRKHFPGNDDLAQKVFEKVKANIKLE